MESSGIQVESILNRGSCALDNGSQTEHSGSISTTAPEAKDEEKRASKPSENATTEVSLFVFIVKKLKH